MSRIDRKSYYDWGDSKFETPSLSCVYTICHSTVYELPLQHHTYQVMLKTRALWRFLDPMSPGQDTYVVSVISEESPMVSTRLCVTESQSPLNRLPFHGHRSVLVICYVAMLETLGQAWLKYGWNSMMAISNLSAIYRHLSSKSVPS